MLKFLACGLLLPPRARPFLGFLCLLFAFSAIVSRYSFSLSVMFSKYLRVVSMAYFVDVFGSFSLTVFDYLSDSFLID